MAGDELRDDSSRPDNGASAPEPRDARRDTLSERIVAQRARMTAPEDRSGPAGGMKGMAEGLKVASEFVAGILVGAGIGYLLDLLAGTGPFGLIVFLLFGFAAGILNVLRAVSGKGNSPTGPRPSGE